MQMHLDTWQWRADLSSAEIDEETGWMRVTGTAAIVGVMDYGTHAELAGVDALKDVDGLKGLPVTLEHPDEMLDSDTIREAQIGTVADAEFDGENVRVKLLITDAGAIATIQAGKAELSPGYMAELEDAPGTYEGQPYRYVQTKRRYNHLSIVDRARRGRRAKLDSWRADGLRVQKEDMDPENNEMVSLEIDGVSYDVPRPVAEAYIALKGGGATQDEDEEKKEEPMQDEAVAAPAPTPAAPAASAAAPAVNVNIGGKMDAAAFEDRIVKRLSKELLGALRKDRDDRDASARRLGDTVAACRNLLPQSYRTDGKTEDQVVYDAICHADPASKPLADKHRTDGSYLRGLLDKMLLDKGVTNENVERVDAEKHQDGECPIAAAKKKQAERRNEPRQFKAVQGGK